MDSRGQGKSSKVTKDITFEQMSNDIHQVLETLKIKSCLIVGHSDGANLALMHCQQFPEEVEGMLLNGGNYEFMGLRPFSRLTAKLEIFGFDLLGLLSKRFKKMSAVVQLQKVDIPIDKALLKCLEIPVFVAVGQHDMILYKHSQEMARFFKHGRLIVVPHHGHFIAWTKPNLFHQLVDQLVILILEQKIQLSLNAIGFFSL